MKIAVPDMISNSYFPVLAAVELGFFRREGLDLSLELLAPADKAYAALRDGAVDFVAAEAHGALAAFPEWQGVKLICAQAQGMYWFLVMRADLGVRRGDLAVVRGRRIGAAPWVELGLRRLLIEAGIEPERDGVTIAPIPGSLGLKVNIGVTAAQALADGVVDGFWANGMGAELAVRRGVGTVVLDVRRGDGPSTCFDYTFASVAATDRLIERVARRGRGRDPRHRGDAGGAQAGPDARRRGRAQAVPGAGGRADRRAGGARCAILRRHDLGADGRRS